MLNILFLLVNLALCFYFIHKKNYAILGYIILFQEIHVIPFNNLGLDSFGFGYYILIASLFLINTVELKFSKKRIIYLLNSKVIWAFFLITFIIAFHALVIGLQSEGARTLVFRYFVQVMPAMVYLILVLDRIRIKDFLEQFGEGILIFGILLGAMLLTTTDALNITDYERSDISDNIGISPIAITRTGCTMFITALMFYLSNKANKNSLFILVSIIFSLGLIVLGTSRGPMASTIISLSCYFLLRKNAFGNFFKKARIVLPFLPFVIIPLILYSGDFAILELYSSRVEGLENFEDMPRYLRYLLAYDFYINQFSFFSSFFLVGAGPAGFDLYFGLSYAHNFLLEIVFEYGLFGIIFVVLFITYCLRHTFKLIRADISEIYLFIPLIVIYLLIASQFSGDLIGWRNLFFTSIILEHIYFQLKMNGFSEKS